MGWSGWAPEEAAAHWERVRNCAEHEYEQVSYQRAPHLDRRMLGAEDNTHKVFRKLEKCKHCGDEQETHEIR